MRVFFAMLILLGIGKLAQSQVNITGVVLDSATHEPLALSLVNIGDQQVVAQIDGTFQVIVPSAGPQTLSVSHVGCDLRTVTIAVTQDTFITVYLPHHLHAFEEVIAYGHEDDQEPNARLVKEISSYRLEQLGAMSIHDALQDMNGVHFLKTGSTIAKPIINGMHSNRVSVINDDSKQEGQQWGTEHAPEIDPLSAGSIEVIKGASTLRFGGDAMGGVIRIVPTVFADTGYTSLSFYSKLESNSAGAQVGFSIENFNPNTAIGQRFVVNVKRNGDGRAPNAVLSNTGFSQLSGSYFGELSMRKSLFSLTGSAHVQQIGILASSHIGNLTDLNVALESDTPLIIRPFTFEIQSPSQLVQHYSGKLKWIHTSDLLGELISSYTIQRNHRQEFDNHNGGEDAALDLRLVTQQLNVRVDKHLHQFRWQYGLMGEQQQNIFRGRYFVPNYLRYKAGAFVIATLEKKNHLIEGGIRYDFQNANTYRFEQSELINQEFNFQGISGNISGRKRFNEDFKMHLSLATRFRSPDINEQFSDGLHHGSAALEFGDVNLKQERSYSINGAINYNHNRIRFQVEPFFHYFSDYIYLKPSGEKQLSIRGAFPVFNYVQTDATYAGVDIDLRYRLSSKLTVELNAALLNVKDVRNDVFIFGIPAQQFGGRLRYNVEHIIGLRNAYWWVGPMYTLQQNRVEANEDFTETPDAYLLVNGELGAQYKESLFHFSFGIKNALNTSYRDYLNRYRYYADDLGINFYITLNYKL